MEPSTSPLLDSQVLVELVLPRVIDLVVSNIVKDESQLHALRTVQSVTFAAGFAVLPAKIKEEYAESIYMVDDVLVSYEHQWLDYSLGATNSLLTGRFHVSNGNIYYTPAAGTIGTFAGSRNVDAITTPSLPTTAAGTVVMNPYVIEQVITTAIAVIRGEIPLAQIALDYSEAKDVA